MGDDLKIAALEQRIRELEAEVMKGHREVGVRNEKIRHWKSRAKAAEGQLRNRRQRVTSWYRSLLARFGFRY